MKFRILTFCIVIYAACSAGHAASVDNSEQATAVTWHEQARTALVATLDVWSEAARADHEALEYDISMADERLNFRPCGNLPAVNRRSAAMSGRITFTVACASPQTWQIHVAVQVNRFASIAVLKQPVQRNTALSQEQIEYRRINTADLNYGYYKEGTEIEGLIAKRALPAGTTLHPGILEYPKLVRKGDQVVIAARDSVMIVKMNGIALADGRLGEQIPVENISSQRKIKATVVGRANVEVSL
jgi:flagella basal body P-ring formation protein FlgA